MLSGLAIIASMFFIADISAEDQTIVEGVLYTCSNTCSVVADGDDLYVGDCCGGTVTATVGGPGNSCSGPRP